MSFPGTANSGYILYSAGDQNILKFGGHGGDLRGVLGEARVSGIAGIPIVNGVPSNDQIIKYDGSQWIFASDEAEAGGGSTTNFPTGLIIGTPAGSGMMLASDTNHRLLIRTYDGVASGDLVARTGHFVGIRIFNNPQTSDVFLKSVKESRDTLYVLNSDADGIINGTFADIRAADFSFDGGTFNGEVNILHNGYSPIMLANGSDISNSGLVLAGLSRIAWTDELDGLSGAKDIALTRSGIGILSIYNHATKLPGSGLQGGIILNEAAPNGVLLKRFGNSTLVIRNGNDTADGNLVVGNLTVNGTHNITGGSSNITQALIWMGW